MLQLAQRTSAPSSVNVSINTAVWIVMCSEPEMRAPARGLVGPYSLRIAIKPGISCSARIISLRPNGASEISATRKSLRDARVDDMGGLQAMGTVRRSTHVCDASRGLLAPIGSARCARQGYNCDRSNL